MANSKIRQGNDIEIWWSLLDAEEHPYILTGRNIAVELTVGTKRVKIKEVEVNENVLHFTYYGKDQKYLGSYNLKYIENDGDVDMVTFDTKDAFTLVEHSWLAIDQGETPETIQLEVVTVSSELDSKIGPRGYSAYEIAVQNGFVGTEEEWLASLKGEQGEPGTTDYNELENKPDLSQFITRTVNDLTNYYLKSETYTKAEVQALIAAINQFHFEVYASLEDVTSPAGNVLYLIGPTGTGSDKYEEYVYSNGQFIKIGDTSIDLSGYVTTQQLNAALALKQDKATVFDIGINGYLKFLNNGDAALYQVSVELDDLVMAVAYVLIGGYTKVICLERGEEAYKDTNDSIYLYGEDGGRYYVTPLIGSIENVTTETELPHSAESIDLTVFYEKPSDGIPSTDLHEEVRDALIAALSAYQKPSGGIPKSDLASAIRTSLNKADTALQTNFYEGDHAYFLGIKLGQEKATMLVEMREHSWNETHTEHYAELLVSTTPDSSYVKVLTFNGESILKFNIADNGEEKRLLIGGYDNDLLSVDFYVTKISGTTPDIQCRMSDGWDDYEFSPYEGDIPLYTKPSSGIPKSDLASSVQTSLGKADTSVQPAALQAVTDLIPAQASPENQLADKNFVNSTVQTETASFKGNWDTWDEVPDIVEGYEFLGGEPDNNDYLVVRDTSLYAVPFPGGYEDYIPEGTVVSDGGDNYIALQTITIGESPLPSEDTEHTYWEPYSGSNPAYEGTWRFKYVPAGSTYDKYNWHPEYQVNEKPLTAAQLAALNSGITDAKVGKLDDLPTRAELTLEEQALDKVFFATYGTTTAAEIATALSAGKIVVMVLNNAYYLLTFDGDNGYVFSSLSGSVAHRIAQVTKDTSTWSVYVVVLENTVNKVTEWQQNPDNNHYPAEKLVKDSIDAVDKVFVATYGTTTNAEIKAAYDAGKIIVAVKDGKEYLQVIPPTDNAAYFCAPAYDGLVHIIRCNSNTWSNPLEILEKTSNKSTSWSQTPSDTKYPSEKLVYDSLYKRGVISQTQTWTQAADGGYDYAMSDLVYGDIPRANIDLFVAAGATFNTTSGYFELNGLTDISYEEMKKIYNAGWFNLLDKAKTGAYAGTFIGNKWETLNGGRTHLMGITYPVIQNTHWNLYGCWQKNEIVEIVPFPKYGANISEFDSLSSFSDTLHLKSIGYIKYMQSSTGKISDCPCLEEANIYGIKASIEIKASPRLSLASIVYMVENAANTSAITITLHATAYARAQADTTEYTYNGQTYTGIIALATAKNITIQSA